MKEKLIDVRVISPNINVTHGEKGEGTTSPAVGDVIKVRASQVSGALKGKVRPVADEAKGALAPVPAELTLENAKAALEASGYRVTKAETPKGGKADG